MIIAKAMKSPCCGDRRPSPGGRRSIFGKVDVLGDHMEPINQFLEYRKAVAVKAAITMPDRMLVGENELEPWVISVEWDANSAVGRGSQYSAKPRSLIGLNVGYRCNL